MSPGDFDRVALALPWAIAAKLPRKLRTTLGIAG